MLVVVPVVQRRGCRRLLQKLRPPKGLLRPREISEEVEGRSEVERHGGGARDPEEEVCGNDDRPQQARGGPAGGPGGEEERAGWALTGFGVAAAALLFGCV